MECLKEVPWQVCGQASDMICDLSASNFLSSPLWSTDLLGGVLKDSSGL